MLAHGDGERKKLRQRGGEHRGTISKACAAKFTKPFLFKYAAITGKADWCIRHACFDSEDVLRTITVSLLANYHEKQLAEVSSVKEKGALSMLKMT